MSTRPASPPPVARWPFFVGDVLFLAIAWVAVTRGEGPPGLGAIVVAFICVLVGVALVLAPFLLDYDARLRVAEASAREVNETQARRLAQTAEQLANAVSRSQSTEEQAGQALGTLEEMAEKLTAHAEELAQTITRAAEREQTSQKAEIERLVRERDDALAALDNRVSTVAAALAEVQAATKKAGTANAKTLDDIRHRLDELAARFAAFSASSSASAAAAPATSTATAPASIESLTTTRSAPAVASEPVAPAPTPAAAPAVVRAPEVVSKPVESPVANSEESDSAPAAAEPAEKPATPAPAKEKERAKPASSSSTNGDEAPAMSAPPPAPVVQRAAPKAAPKPAHLELPLEGMPEPRPAVRHSRRDNASITSLVATAYIGIGNKLFLRGEGPGLNWDSGVPMQFLAIGKWGWTTTDATAPVTCRVYRNDDTPMLDENIIISPGTKSEIAPRF